MPIQTTYDFNYTAGMMGMPYDLSLKHEVTGEAALAVEFGYGLVLDSTRTPANNRLGVKVPTATGGVFAGVAMYDRTQQVNTGTEAGLGDLTTTEGTSYPASEPIKVGRKRRVYVWSEQGIKPGDPVYLRHTANGAGKVPGYFRKDADTDKADQISAGASWVSITSAAGIAVLEVNLP